MSNKIVVFGGCGFIGSYVVEELLKKRYDVLAVDLNSSPYVDNKYFKECDILDSQNVNKLVEGASIVYNFAGLANLDDAIENPIKAIELNVMGNLNILNACKENNIERFIYASSAYAMSEKGSFYGISKLTSEKLIEEYYTKFGLKYTIVRYGSVYGDRYYHNNYIYNLVKKAIETKEINHSGDGEEVREYIHVEDIAKLSIKIIESKEFINEHIILTGVERMHRKQLFYMIKEILGDNIKINFNNDGYHNHYKTTPYSFSPTRSKKLVANPYVDLGQGILDCITDIEKNNDH